MIRPKVNQLFKGADMKYIFDFIVSRLRRKGVNVDPAVIGSLGISTSGLDSLELLEFIMEVEDRFGVVIKDSAISETTTVDALACHIAQLIGSGGTSG